MGEDRVRLAVADCHCRRCHPDSFLCAGRGVTGVHTAAPSALPQPKRQRLTRRGFSVSLVRQHRAIWAVSERLKRDLGAFHRETNDFGELTWSIVL